VNDALLLRIFLVVVAYLAGSIPFGVIAARLSGGTDPREVGSGRTGGTNALRALGRKWAAFVVTGDLAKGALPVLLARIATGGDSTAEVLVAAAAVIGSARSIFLGFQGGRMKKPTRERESGAPTHCPPDSVGFNHQPERIVLRGIEWLPRP